MEWLGVEKSQNRTQFDGEVVINYENHGTEKRVQFKFRKNSSYKITDGDMILIAKDGNKVYFKGTDNKGFKLCDYAQNVRIIKVRLDRFPIREEDLGEYILEFDSALHLHYICFARKLEKSFNWEGK